jgi:hypothetical protein
MSSQFRFSSFNFTAFNSIALDREIPVFSLRFIITATNKVPIQDGGNLNELEIVTEEYLDRRFHEVFKNTPANYQYTAVQLKTTTDPFILDVYATSTFQIPGEVPTYVYLTEQVKKAFKVPLDVNQYETNFEYYTKELSLMSDTNPFYKTDDLAFIQRDNDWMIKDTNPKGTKQSLSDALSDKNHVIVPILGILGFLVLVAVGLLWIKGKENGVQVYENELTLDTKPEKNDERDGDAICSTPSYGKDEETARYLASVREELSKSNDLEDVKISDATVRIGELTEKPEPLGSYISPNYCDEVSCDEVEMECQFDEEYEKEYEEEYEEEEIEEDVGISINLKEDPPPASNVEIV